MQKDTAEVCRPFFDVKAAPVPSASLLIPFFTHHLGIHRFQEELGGLDFDLDEVGRTFPRLHFFDSLFLAARFAIAFFMLALLISVLVFTISARGIRFLVPIDNSQQSSWNASKRTRCSKACSHRFDCIIQSETLHFFVKIIRSHPLISHFDLFVSTKHHSCFRQHAPLNDRASTCDNTRVKSKTS